MDITTLVYSVLLGLALVGADAYLYADSIIFRVEVAKKYADSGLSSDFATTLFSHELQTIFANESVIRTPLVRAANDQSVISVIANSLKLDGLTFAFQHLFGLDPVEVRVALIDDPKNVHMLVTGTAKDRPPFALMIVRADNEGMAHFVRRAALETASQLDTYHAALYLLEKNDVENHMPQLKKLLQTSIDAQPKTPTNLERALFRNLLGITALLENNVARAGELFEQTVRDADNYSAALLNLGFVRVEQDRYQAAIDTVRPVIEGRTIPRNPALTAAAHTISGVANWALKRYDVAERHFAEATRINPITSDTFEYWGAMLAERGRAAEGNEKRRIGAQNLASFEQYPEIATLYFWLTERDNVPLARRTLPRPSR